MSKLFVEACELGVAAFVEKQNAISVNHTAIDYVQDFHHIGITTREVLDKEFPEKAAESHKVLANAIFTEISKTRPTEEDLLEGKAKVDSLLIRSAVAYGVLSGITCPEHH